MCNYCIDDLVDNLGSKDFRHHVNAELARKLKGESSPPPYERAQESDSEDDDESDENYVYGGDADNLPGAQRRERRPRNPNRPPPGTVVPINPDGKFLRRTTRNPRWTKNTPVDPSEVEPCPPSVDPKEWITWSSVHRRSYLGKEKDRNAFLYRNPPPGVAQRNGPWTMEEKQKFMARLAEVRENGDGTGKWGLFSEAIPGRVGYQCSNFYRLLIMHGEVEDPRYQFDENGKLRYLSQGKSLLPRSSNAGRKRVVVPITLDELMSLCFFRKKKPESIQSVSAPVVVSRPVVPVPEEKLCRYERWALQNPIPDAIDPLTGEKMRVPAMSPDGYVCDYTTWMKTKENPFTRERLNKRDLIRLTTENYEELKERIRNL
jgi:hypothetical protein